METILIALVLMVLALQIDTVRRVARINGECQARRESYDRRFAGVWRALRTRGE